MTVGMRVLVAEDNPIIRMDLAQTLRDMGAVEVGQCSRGDEAVKMALRKKWDLILLDVVMPVMDGLKAAKIISGRMLAPVVLVTAHSDSETMSRAEESGVLAYLVKPVDPRQLMVSVHLAMARFEELKKIHTDVVSLQEKKSGLKTIEKAKKELQQKWGMSEEQAHGYIRQQSMSLQKKMFQIAEDILAGRLRPGQ